MLGKCSNPSCRVPFRYLRDGKLFRLEADPRLRTSKPNKLEYFWLCDRCSPRMSLRIGGEGEVRPVLFPGSVQRDFDGIGIALIERSPLNAAATWRRLATFAYLPRLPRGPAPTAGPPAGDGIGILP